MAGFAGLSRFMRSSMLENLRQDFVLVARSKGLAERVVMYKHVLRNSLIPIVTIMASIIPGLMSGSIIIETLFSIPGIGQLSYECCLGTGLSDHYGSVYHRFRVNPGEYFALRPIALGCRSPHRLQPASGVRPSAMLPQHGSCRADDVSYDVSSLASASEDLRLISRSPSGRACGGNSGATAGGMGLCVVVMPRGHGPRRRFSGQRQAPTIWCIRGRRMFPSCHIAIWSISD